MPRTPNQAQPLWHDGFWARWAFVTPPIDQAPGTGRFPTSEIEIPSSLIDPLKAWHQRLGIPNVEITAALDEDLEPTGSYNLEKEETRSTSMALEKSVIDAYYAYHDGLLEAARESATQGQYDLLGNYGRMAEKALRIAILLASVSGFRKIELCHWVRAQEIVERWRANLHDLFEQINTTQPSSGRLAEDKICDVLTRHPASTAAQISRYIRGMSTQEVDTICLQLVNYGKLQIVETTKSNTKRYDLANGRQ